MQTGYCLPLHTVGWQGPLVPGIRSTEVGDLSPDEHPGEVADGEGASTLDGSHPYGDGQTLSMAGSDGEEAPEGSFVAC